MNTYLELFIDRHGREAQPKETTSVVRNGKNLAFFFGDARVATLYLGRSVYSHGTEFMRSWDAQGKEAIAIFDRKTGLNLLKYKLSDL